MPIKYIVTNGKEVRIMRKDHGRQKGKGSYNRKLWKEKKIREKIKDVIYSPITIGTTIFAIKDITSTVKSAKIYTIHFLLTPEKQKTNTFRLKNRWKKN